MNLSDCDTFIGIDLHKTCLTIGALDRDKTVLGTHNIATHCENKIVEAIRSFPGPVAVVIESVGMYEWLWELLEDKVAVLVLADAAEVKHRRQRGKAKTDRNDALLLAKLLCLGEIPASYVPPKPLRELRKLGRHYHALSQFGADVKTRMRWVLNQHNDRGPEHLDSKSAQKWLLTNSAGLDRIAMLTCKHHFAGITHIEALKAEAVMEMRLIAKRPEYQEDFRRLQTVPGFGDVISFIVYAEIADFARFRDGDAIACYTGLTERTNESAGVRKTGHISRCGNPTLRWALVEAATTLIRADTEYEALHQRLVNNMGGPTGINKHKAKVAVAQKLIRRVRAMMLAKEDFRRGKSTGQHNRLNAARFAKKMSA